jgi:hypothetical protein
MIAFVAVELRPFALSGLVSSNSFELQHAQACVRPHGAHARVFAVKRRLMRAERPHHDRRQIVLTVGALRISARPYEQSWCAVDHDAPSMRASFADTRAILDVELEAEQVRHLLVKPRRFVLATTPLGESNGCRAVSTGSHHHHSSPRNHLPRASPRLLVTVMGFRRTLAPVAR